VQALQRELRDRTSDTGRLGHECTQTVGPKFA
jgi:hypothetical protein